MSPSRASFPLLGQAPARPMNSLNASVAAALLLFEAVRQRTRSDVGPSGLLRAVA